MQHEARDSQSAVALFIPNLMGGGAERITINLAHNFAARGHDVDLVVAGLSGELKDRVSEDVRIVDLGRPRTLTALPSLVAYLRRERPRALLSALGHANVVALWAARFAGFRGPVVVAEHTQLQPSIPLSKGALFAFTVRLTYKRAHRVIAVSHGTELSLRKFAGIKADQIEVIYNPVLPDDHIYMRRQTEPRPEQLGVTGTPVFLAIGRLSAEKNFELLLNAFHRVRSRVPARLVILGEGPERPALEHLITSLEMHSDVSLPGFVPDPIPYLEHADAFVMSSDHEALPTAMIEALAIGIPIVSTDCPTGPREVLAGGEFGVLVPPGDASALADAMLMSLERERQTPPHPWLKQFTESVATDAYLQVLGLERHK